MALVKCKECGESVSTKAQSCPNCGSKQPKKTSVGFQNFISAGLPDMTFFRNEIDDFVSLWNKFCTK